MTSKKPTADEIKAMQADILAARATLQEEREARPHDYVHSHEMHFLISKHINLVRKRKGLSMKAFADKIDVDKAQLTRWLSGRQNLTVKSIARMQAALEEPIVMVADQSYLSFEERGLKGTPHCWHEEESDDDIVLISNTQNKNTSLVQWKSYSVKTDENFDDKIKEQLVKTLDEITVA